MNNKLAARVVFTEELSQADISPIRVQWPAEGWGDDDPELQTAPTRVDRHAYARAAAM